jgi:hypothetical protein
MKDLLLYIARNLVDDPDAVTVTETVSGNQELTLELRVAPDDMGKVIGRQGRQGDPHRGPFPRPAGGRQGFRRYRRLKSPVWGFPHTGLQPGKNFFARLSKFSEPLGSSENF